MPLNSHSFLVAQGWSGKGTGLREGAISRPIAVSQKRTLAGVGKDRDEAFPFWDHLFTAAASTIKIKVGDFDDEDTSSSEDTPTQPEFKRTSTGILSNRRPNHGISIDHSTSDSGASTPNESGSGGEPSRLGLLATAKRDAAKRGLYSRFFRGPVIGPDDDVVPPSSTSSTPAPSGAAAPALEASTSKATARDTSPSSLTPTPSAAIQQEISHCLETSQRDVKTNRRKTDETKEGRRERKRLKKEAEAKGKQKEVVKNSVEKPDEDDEDKAARRERRRLNREAKATRAARKVEAETVNTANTDDPKSDKKRKRRSKASDDTDLQSTVAEPKMKEKKKNSKASLYADLKSTVSPTEPSGCDERPKKKRKKSKS